ncbi:Uncharacterized protein TCM_006336 [Theobroma cacao]|uniref:Uncharacterized protein n=1 Tax=Theobroma cacao TaxID=3641 RepID=A0A061DXZ0_THECC|nr:Uncharacterized protein TCM_006336 [Theobroma cacao]
MLLCNIQRKIIKHSRDHFEGEKSRAMVWLIRALALDVSNRIIAANNKNPTILTLSSAAPKVNRFAPDNLSVVQAVITTAIARVGGVVIVRLLASPHFQGVDAVEVAIAFSEVLTVGSI